MLWNAVARSATFLVRTYDHAGYSLADQLVTFSSHTHLSSYVLPILRILSSQFLTLLLFNTASFILSSALLPPPSGWSCLCIWNLRYQLPSFWQASWNARSNNSTSCLMSARHLCNPVVGVPPHSFARHMSPNKIMPLKWQPLKYSFVLFPTASYSPERPCTLGSVLIHMKDKHVQTRV